jgi:hypothetical protein
MGAVPEPIEFAICLFDGEVVNAGEPPLHQTCSVIFPVLVAERAEPASAVIMPFMGIADGDPTFDESPELLDESVIELLCPLSGEERYDLGASVDEFGAVPPTAVRRKASDTFPGSREFHPSSARRTFCVALSRLNGGAMMVIRLSPSRPPG